MPTALPRHEEQGAHAPAPLDRAGAAGAAIYEASRQLRCTLDIAFTVSEGPLCPQTFVSLSEIRDRGIEGGAGSNIASTFPCCSPTSAGAEAALVADTQLV